MVKKKVPDEWCGISNHPSNNIAPLIKFQRQVTMPSYPLRVVGIHDSFTTWSNSKRNVHGRFTRFCHQSNLANQQHMIVKILTMSSKGSNEVV